MVGGRVSGRWPSKWPVDADVAGGWGRWPQTWLVVGGRVPEPKRCLASPKEPVAGAGGRGRSECT